MKLVTLDFETFYDVDYSLTRLTTEEYIRDIRFEIIGVGVKVDTGVTEWYSGSHAYIKKCLAQYDWNGSLSIAHNAMFDMAIMSWILGIKPKRIADTLSMGRAVHGLSIGNSLAKLAEHYELGEKGTEVVNAKGKKLRDFIPYELEKYAGYCKNDVDLTCKLFLTMLPHFKVKELKVISQTVKMFTEPVLTLDVPMLEQHLLDVKFRKQKLISDISYKLGAPLDKKVLMSNDKFAGVLTSLGVTPPMKISKATGEPAYAFAKTDEEFKALLEHESEAVQTLCAARIGNKSTLEETRTQRFIDIGKRGCMPVPLNYYAAHTGRWGGCLVADTEVIVYNVSNGVEVKRIVDVLLDDLVWDGEAFVEHEGVVFSGYSEVINYDGIQGTEDHVVFTDTEEISLREAMQRGHKIKVARSPTMDDVETARRLICNNKE